MASRDGNCSFIIQNGTTLTTTTNTTAHTVILSHTWPTELDDDSPSKAAKPSKIVSFDVIPTVRKEWQYLSYTPPPCGQDITRQEQMEGPVLNAAEIDGSLPFNSYDEY